MFDFSDDHDRTDKLILDPTSGLVISQGHDHDDDH